MGRGAEIKGASPRPAVTAGAGGRNGRYVTVQALTNEEKKNWGISAFTTMARFMARKDSSLNFVFLAAPSEESMLAPEIQNLRASGVRAEISVCDLSAAAALIANSELLITGDTSIKHLGSAFEVPILELSLGSSDFHFTGAYSEKVFILQGNVSCAPCSPGGPCPLKRKICADALHPHIVAQIALNIIQRTSLDHFENLFRGKFLPNGMWTAVPVSKIKESELATYEL
jgi:ADP-heptose:LPS heptosyltransferase